MLLLSPPRAEADNIGGLPKKSQGGMPLKKKQHCPVCGKWLFCADIDAQGTFYIWCRHCKKEIKIKI